MEQTESGRLLPVLLWSTAIVLLTLGGLTLGHYLHWKQQRRDARVWLEDHPFAGTGNIRLVVEPRPPLPWGLRLVGEEPETIILIERETYGELRPAVYRERAARLTQLFPEAQVIDLNENVEGSEVAE
jgi:hypothetical protein